MINDNSNMKPKQLSELRESSCITDQPFSSLEEQVVVKKYPENISKDLDEGRKKDFEIANLSEYSEFKTICLVSRMIKNIHPDNIYDIITILFKTFIPFTKNGIRQLVNIIIDTTIRFPHKQKILFEFTRELIMRSEMNNFLERIPKILDEKFVEIGKESIEYLYYCVSCELKLFSDRNITVKECKNANNKQNCLKKKENHCILKIYHNGGNIESLKAIIQADNVNKLHIFVVEQDLDISSKRIDNLDLKAYSAICIATKCFEYLLLKGINEERELSKYIINRELTDVIINCLGFEKAITKLAECQCSELFEFAVSYLEKEKYKVKIENIINKAPIYFEKKFLPGIKFVFKNMKYLKVQKSFLLDLITKIAIFIHLNCL